MRSGVLTLCGVLILTASTILIDTPPDRKNPGIEVSLWAKDPMLKNPVALSHDAQGRVYVTEANRRKSADLDVRTMRGLEPIPWPALDYSIQSVEQRREVLHTYLATNSPYSNPWMQDFDGDGVKNWRDLLAKTERVNLLEDTDGDGRADKATVFAEDFNTEVTGTAGGVLWHNGKVYFTVIPDLWLLEDQDNDGKAEQRTSLITGHGVHIGQGGHDLHGLTVGPDGRIYWSIGDKGIDITSKEGRHFFYPNQGVIMRSEPDGSNFEVFAHGLRNCMELAFDDFGNLFCVDNDGDFRGERERLVYVTQHSDTGWRINWQFNHIDSWAKSVGLPSYNPWMEEQLYLPHFEGQAAYITPTLENYSDGPAGFTRNPGTALSEDYKDYYFLTQFPSQKITAFQLQPKGAAFEMVNEHLFQDGFMATGLSFGPDGALYVADWAGQWEPTEEGGIFKLDVPAEAQNPFRERTKQLIQAGMEDQSVDSLIQWLSYPDQRVRLAAQFELVKQNRNNILIQTALEKQAPQSSRIHSLWGLGQLARVNSLHSVDAIQQLLFDEDPQIRIQTTRLIREAPALFSDLEASLIRLLQDEDLSVRFHAAQTLGDVGTAASIQPLLDLLAGDHGKDPFIRHGVVTGLTGIGIVDPLLFTKTSDSNSVRIGAVLTMRRLKSPFITLFLDDPDPLVVLEAARAIHDDFGIPEAMPALAYLLNNTPHTANEALMRRVLNANLRLGNRENAEAVLTFLQSNENKEMQEEAVAILRSWTRPPAIDRVERRYRELPERDALIVKDLLQQHLAGLLDTGASGLTLLNHYDVAINPAALHRRLGDESRTNNERLATLNALMAMEDERKQALNTAQNSNAPNLRMAALEALAIRDEKAALRHIEKVLASDGPTAEHQHAIQQLGKLKSKKAKRVLGSMHAALEKNKVAQELQLDVFLAANPSEAVAPHEYLLAGGNATRGESIFLEHPAAQCIRCHAVEPGDGSEVGPNLKGIGQKYDRAYLLESLVSPSVKIAEEFGSQGTISSMPPMGGILSPEELRDVVAYLAEL